jgi:FixJ family two-component response regulator
MMTRWPGMAHRHSSESLGYKTVSFSSAEHFLASDAIAETTCLITDLQMPGLSGLELQETLRSQGHRTPVILITAYPNDRRRNRAIDGGAVGFLSKPFDEASLIGLAAAIKSRSDARFTHEARRIAASIAKLPELVRKI